MKLLKAHPLLSLVNSYLIDSPAPSNITYIWNFGSLLGSCLVLQIITGVTLAMHYLPSIDAAFCSVEHIMRDVNNGWLIRYLHANVASFFFLFVYLHIGKALYYGSFRAPRTLLWSIGVVIFLVMVITAFLGYVLPFGQMSLWGGHESPTCMSLPFIMPRTKATNRIGPHNIDVLSMIFGSLLGDSHAERHGNGVRISFQQESSNVEYLMMFWRFLSDRGYCSTKKPKLLIRTAKAGQLRYYFKVHSWTFSSFIWIHSIFYKDGVKIVPDCIGDYFTPLALAVWIKDAMSYGLKLATHNFSYNDVLFLCSVLKDKYDIVATPNRNRDQWTIYIHSESMPILRGIVKDFVVPSMLRKQA
jgi:ubiquinol-cytochrome c reductase cytochrome b subunit